MLLGFALLAAPAQARGIDQRVLPVADFERHFDRIARGARLVEGDDPFLPHQRIHQRGLADVRPPDDRHARAGILAVDRLAFLRKRLEHRFDEVLDALAVRSGDRNRKSPSPSCWKSADAESGCMPSALLTAIQTRRSIFLSCSAIVRSAATMPLFASSTQTTRVGLRDGLLGLARHLEVDALLRVRLQTAGIDHQERPVAEPPFAVVAVARHPRRIHDDRVAALGEAVEQRRLADVGPADDDDDGFHCGANAYRFPARVCTRNPVRSRSGAAAIALPSVAMRPMNAPESRASRCT